jgi:hypothetical protein
MVFEHKFVVGDAVYCSIGPLLEKATVKIVRELKDGNPQYKVRYDKHRDRHPDPGDYLKDEYVLEERLAPVSRLPCVTLP